MTEAIDWRSGYERVADKIRRGEELTDNEKEATARCLMLVGQARYEQSGSMFISNFWGDTESDGLPEYVNIVPTYGVDFRVYGVYKKIHPLTPEEKEERRIKIEHGIFD